MTIYPLLLKPPLAENSLFENIDENHKESSTEELELSCRRETPSLIQNGEMAGKTLPEAIERWGKAVLGEKAAELPCFPIRIKLIDAREELPVTVHPNKTELWYIVDCEPGSKLVYGFSGGLTRDEFRGRIRNGTLSEVCNFMPVKKGDVFRIDAGTVHAVGAGMLVTEIGQNLPDDDAESSELDGEAAETVLLRPSCVPCGAVGKITKVPGGACRRLASCKFFTAQLLEITGSMLIGCMESFLSLLCVDGCCTLEWDGGKPLALKKGASVFLPAGVTAHIKVPAGAKAQMLCSRI